MRSCDFIVLIGVGASAGVALAHPPYLTAWTTRYPTSTLPARMTSVNGSACYICHQPSSVSNAGNCYKNALRDSINAGNTIEQALAAVEGLDSDGDGVPNGVEILAPRADLPGQIGYNPGLVGATGTDPCGASPTQPVTNQLETPPKCYANCDGSTGTPVLTAADFTCFLQKFRAGDAYANCDGSTGTPQLTAADFTCFLTSFRTGCP